MTIIYTYFTIHKLPLQWHRGLPIEVLSFAYKVVKVKIEKSLGGTADLRMATQKAVSVFIYSSIYLSIYSVFQLAISIHYLSIYVCIRSSIYLSLSICKLAFYI